MSQSSFAYTDKWFQVLLSNNDNATLYQSFVSTQ